MNKKQMFTMGMILSALLMAACGTVDSKTEDSSQSSTVASSSQKDSITIDEWFSQLKKANQTIESVAQKTVMDVKVKAASADSDGSEKHQVFEAQTQYDDKRVVNSKLTKEETVREAGETTMSRAEDLWLGQGDSSFKVYQKTSSSEDWSFIGEANDVNIDPDYFAFLKVIYGMEDDFELEEKGDTYLLTLANNDARLVTLFSEEFNLSVSGIDQNELDKTFELTFNKETLFLKDYKMILKYSGEKGDLSMNINGEYSDFNAIEDSIFADPNGI